MTRSPLINSLNSCKNWNKYFKGVKNYNFHKPVDQKYQITNTKKASIGTTGGAPIQHQFSTEKPQTKTKRSRNQNLFTENTVDKEQSQSQMIFHNPKSNSSSSVTCLIDKIMRQDSNKTEADMQTNTTKDCRTKGLNVPTTQKLISSLNKLNEMCRHNDDLTNEILIQDIHTNRQHIEDSKEQVQEGRLLSLNRVLRHTIFLLCQIQLTCYVLDEHKTVHTSRNAYKGLFKLGAKTTLLEASTPRYKSKIKPDQSVGEKNATALSKGQQ